MIQEQPRRPLIVLLLLSLCLLFLAFLALPSGVQLLQDPSGGLMQMPAGYLQYTPFADYTLPGLWLVAIYGVGSLLILLALWMRPQSEILARLTRWTHEYWGWNLAVLLGVILLVWLTVQVIVFPAVPPIQAVLYVVAFLMIALPLLPPMRRYYQEQSATA
jgi:hypothetical protein